jgi:hypothetical protein
LSLSRTYFATTSALLRRRVLLDAQRRHVGLAAARGQQDRRRAPDQD